MKTKKTLLCLSVLLSLLLLLTSCGQEAASDNDAAAVDVDLSQLSTTVAYSELYNIMVNSDEYLGKVIRLSGELGYYQDPDTGAEYVACIVSDSTACCALGLEFVLPGNPSYPDDYPDPGVTFTVTGTLSSYDEYGTTYYHLINASVL